MSLLAENRYLVGPTGLRNLLKMEGIAAQKLFQLLLQQNLRDPELMHESEEEGMRSQ